MPSGLFVLLCAGTYAVLGRRRARVIREELREGSDLFSILAYLPAQASFGLADDLRARTSGGASAALMLSHWERLQVRGLSLLSPFVHAIPPPLHFYHKYFGCFVLYHICTLLAA